MAFWGVEVKPGNPYTHTHVEDGGRLRLTQATLGSEFGKGGKGGGKSVVQCNVGDDKPIYLCSLIPEKVETCHLELEFEEDDDVIFSVLGPMSVHLSGYYIAPSRYDGDDEIDMYGEDIGESDTDSEAMEGSDSEDDECDSDFIDDDDMGIIQSSPGRKSSVIIEELPEDDKPANDEGQKGSKKHQASDNGDKHQLVVRVPPPESLESEDEDGFPVSFPESKKSGEKGSRKDRGPHEQKSNEDRKRKSDDISDHPDSSSLKEVRAENDGTLKKKRKAKDKKAAEMKGSMYSEKVNSEEKESKQKDFPADQVDASLATKQKKTKNNNGGTSEAAGQKNDDNGVEEATAQEAKKKKNKKKKKKTQDKDTSENQAPADIMESDSKKKPLQARTFGNGMIIEEVAMGKPDGKKASPASKVSVKYIGKLKNGTIFDSTVGKRPFEFRLGVGQVIKGWDIGINGMRVGDKRRLTIPPSMGYGDQRIGKIPQNSTLVFDVELVNVK